MTAVVGGQYTTHDRDMKIFREPVEQHPVAFLDGIDGMTHVQLPLSTTLCLYSASTGSRLDEIRRSFVLPDLGHGLQHEIKLCPPLVEHFVF